MSDSAACVTFQHGQHRITGVPRHSPSIDFLSDFRRLFRLRQHGASALTRVPRHSPRYSNWTPTPGRSLTRFLVGPIPPLIPWNNGHVTVYTLVFTLLSQACVTRDFGLVSTVGKKTRWVITSRPKQLVITIRTLRPIKRNGIKTRRDSISSNGGLHFNQDREALKELA